ncbi:MAG: hypothetical protein ACRDOL_28770 [Streptosporangiaceae bacterium]
MASQAADQSRTAGQPSPQRGLAVIYGALMLAMLLAVVHADVIHAYSLALHPVFLYAIPVALVAFVLSWFLREVPLRATSSVGIGEGLGAGPPERSSVQEVERSLTRLGGADLRRRGPQAARLRAAGRGGRP